MFKTLTFFPNRIWLTSLLIFTHTYAYSGSNLSHPENMFAFRTMKSAAKQGPGSQDPRPKPIKNEIKSNEDNSKRPASGGPVNDEYMHLVCLGLPFLIIILGLLCFRMFNRASERLDSKISQKATKYVSEEMKRYTEAYLGTSLVSQDHFDSVFKIIEKQTEAVKIDTHTLRSEFAEMRQSFISINTSLDLKDKRIRDLEAGIDLKFKKLFAISFLKPYRRLVDEEWKNVEPSKTVEHMAMFLKDAMGLCDIQEIQVEENTVYSPDFYISGGVKVSGAIKVVKQVFTDKKENDRKIIKVHVKGYLLNLPEGGSEIISPSEVSIYVYNTATGVSND